MTKAIKNMIRIISKEGEDFEVSVEITQLSEWMKEKYEELDDSGRADDDQELPLPHVKSSILSKVIEFCEHHLIEPMEEIEKPIKTPHMKDCVQDWYAKFITVSQEELFELLSASLDLKIKPLNVLCYAAVACLIKGRTPEQIRKLFHLANDFPPDEEMQIREENKWCLEEE